MKKLGRLGLVALLAFMFPLIARATATSTIVGHRIKVKSVADCRTGEWLNNFSVAKKYALDNGLPFFAFWTNGENCSHCTKFEGCVNATAFRTWMATSGVVFWFGYNGDSSSEDANGGVGYNWCLQNQSLYPLVRVYWKAKKGTVLADGTVLTADKVIVDKAAMGDDLDNRLKAAEGGTAKVLARVKSYFKQYAPTPVSSYKGGEFAVPNLGNVSLQAEVGLTTGEFTIPLTRTNTTVQAETATNLVVIALADETVTNTVVWTAGVTNAATAFTLPTNLTAGVSYTLTLIDAATGETNETAAVKVVASQANSPSNPYWLGERVAPGLQAAGAPTLGWGEWTVDLDAAQAKAKADGGTTLVLVGGTTWCPDCAATEHYVLENAAFKAWCVANKVALAVVDVPNYNGTQTSSLLSYDINDTLYDSSKKTYSNYRYVTYNYSGVTNLTLRYQSGAGYLSRHNLKPTDEDVVALKEKFRQLACNAIADGGLKRPETTATRMGVPTLIALRSDGTVAGRITAFAVSGATSYKEGYLKRFSELIAAAADTEEENNDNPLSVIGSDTVLSRGMMAGTKSISAVDTVDYYPIDARAVGPTVKFALNGTTAGTDDAEVTLSVCNNAKTTLETIATVTTNLGAGVELTCKVPNTNCFLKVAFPTSSANSGLAASGTFFDFGKSESSVCGYTISTDCVLAPTETNQTYTVEDGVATVTIAVTQGTTYKFVNVKADDAEFQKHFDAGVSDDLYIAKADESATVPLASISAAFQYRIWKTGRIGFSVSAASVSEKDATYTVELVRQDGSAGTAKLKLHLDAAQSSQLAEVFALDFEDGKEFSWADGETATQTAVIRILDNAYSDGNQHVRLTVDQESGSSDAGLGTAAFDLTIREDDAAVAGKLALTGVAPLEAKTGVVYARQDTEITLGVKRVGGTAGSLAGTVAVSTGTISTSDFSWAARESATRSFTLTVPASSVKLTLSGVDGTKVDSSSRALTVYPVAADAPQFVMNSYTIAATRYVAMPETSIAIDPAYLEAAGEISVAKVSGSLPAGIKAALNATKDALVVSGVPTKAGTTKAVYRVSKGSVKGLTVTLDFSVADPVVAASAGTAPVNASVATTRTISDILIVDDDSTNLVGVLSLTIPRTGKVSAKLRYVDSDFGTLSFASSSWSELAADGTLTASIVNKATGLSLLVKAGSDGTIVLSGLDDDYGYLLPTADEVFSADKPATDWRGTYTVSLPLVNPDTQVLARGAGYLVLKMSSASALRKGRMTYAGMLPNGKGFSGTATLQPADWDASLATPNWAKARMAFLLQSSADGLGGVLSIDRAKAVAYGTNQREVVSVAEEDGVPFAIPHWIHRETVTDEADYAVDLGVYGGKYEATENWKDFYTSYYGLDDGNELSFFADSTAIGFSDDLGAASAWDPTGYGITLGYTAKTKTNTFARQSGAATGFTLGFDSANGIVKGKFRLPTEDGGYATMTYRAVVLPGWGASGCTDCGVAGVALDRPFVSGAAWCKDTFLYEGAARRTKVVRGCEVSIGVEAGK